LDAKELTVTTNLKPAPFPLTTPVVRALVQGTPSRHLTSVPVLTLDEVAANPFPVAPERSESRLVASRVAPEEAPEPVPASSGFRSWVEDYQPAPARFNTEAVRIALSRRGEATRKQSAPSLKHVFAKQREFQQAAEHRQSDPFEQAKLFLQRLGPVFSADLHNGPRDRWFVSGQRAYLTRDELFTLATKKGWAAK
jgi:hypothetical protein